MIGNAIYNAIVDTVGQNFAGKITGMVIEENAVNQQMMFTDNNYFNNNINNAY